MLHGARVRETPEDLNEREIRKEIRAVVPELFGGELTCSYPCQITRLSVHIGIARPNYLSADALLEDCPMLSSASRFEQVRIFRQWLLPIFHKVFDA